MNLEAFKRKHKQNFLRGFDDLDGREIWEGVETDLRQLLAEHGRNERELWKQYVRVLGKEIESLIGVAHAHGWESKLAVEGERIRQSLSKFDSSNVEFFSRKT